MFFLAFRIQLTLSTHLIYTTHRRLLARQLLPPPSKDCSQEKPTRIPNELIILPGGHRTSLKTAERFWVDSIWGANYHHLREPPDQGLIRRWPYTCLCLRPENRPSVFAFFALGSFGVGGGGGNILCTSVHAHDVTLDTSYSMYFGARTWDYAWHVLYTSMHAHDVTLDTSYVLRQQGL